MVILGYYLLADCLGMTTAGGKYSKGPYWGDLHGDGCDVHDSAPPVTLHVGDNPNHPDIVPRPIGER